MLKQLILTLMLDTYSFWRVGPDAIATYAAAGGEVNGEIPAGPQFRARRRSERRWMDAD